jgi:hypothetical protein
VFVSAVRVLARDRCEGEEGWLSPRTRQRIDQLLLGIDPDEPDHEVRYSGLDGADTGGLEMKWTNLEEQVIVQDLSL